MLVAPLERRLHQRNRHVQGRISLCASGRRESREGIHPVIANDVERRSSGQCLDTPRSRYIPETPQTLLPANGSLTSLSALALADEYGIRLWVAALLDPEPIAHGTGSESHHSYKSPPPYQFKDMVNGTGRSPEKKAPAESKYSTRGRRSASVRSESPGAQTRTPGRPKATPRTRRTRGTLSRVDESASLGSDSLNGDARLPPVRETVKIEVETTTHQSGDGDEAEESTKVNVEMPLGHPDLPIPNDTTQMLKEARRMVAEAERLGGPATGKGKRKAEEMVDEDDEVGLQAPVPAKKARKIEVELRKERIKRKAVTGIAASLAIGYVGAVSLLTLGRLLTIYSALIPSIMAAFSSWL